MGQISNENIENMKIAWLTPFTQKSAIGHYSKIVVEELAYDHDMVIWIDKSTKNLITTYVPVHLFDPYDSKTTAELQRYDYVVYNMGDHPAYHTGIYEMLVRYPGIVILHDQLLYDFFKGYSHIHKEKKDLFKSIIKLYYPHLSGRENKFDALAIDGKLPLFQPALISAQGIIVHSQSTLDAVQSYYPGPVYQLPLPYYAKSHQVSSRSKTRKINKRIHLLTIGINHLKKIHIILEVIGKNDEIRKNIHYAIVGHFERRDPYCQLLLNIVKKYRLENVVTFYGYLSNNDFQHYLKKTDICLNLRTSMCGGSWSILDEFNAEKAVIVSDSGFFSDIPNSAVLKIPIDSREKLSLNNALVKLIYDRDLRIKMGIQAKKYALTTYTTKRYQLLFEKFLQEVDKTKKEMLLINKISQEIGAFSWSGIVPLEDEVDTILGE